MEHPDLMGRLAAGLVAERRQEAARWRRIRAVRKQPQHPRGQASVGVGSTRFHPVGVPSVARPAPAVPHQTLGAQTANAGALLRRGSPSCGTPCERAIARSQQCIES